MTKILALLLGLTASIYSVHAQDNTTEEQQPITDNNITESAFKSVTVQESPTNFTIGYEVLDANSLRITFFLENYNISGWTKNDSSQGAWAGIGYNTSDIEGQNITLCRYFFSNSTNETDQFICQEGLFNSTNTPVFTPSNNTNETVVNVNTTRANLTFVDQNVTIDNETTASNQTSLANFTVEFIWLFNSTSDNLTDAEGNPINQTNILNQNETTIVWAYGDIIDFEPVRNLDQNGTALLNLTSEFNTNNTD